MRKICSVSWSILAAALAALLGNPASAVVISVEGGRFIAEANYSNGPSTDFHTNPLTVPKTESLYAQSFGPYGAVTSGLTYTLANSNITIEFNHSIPQQQGFWCDPFDPFCQPPPPPDPGSAYALAEITFKSNAIVPYVLSGFYNSSSPLAPGMQLVVELCDNGLEGTLCGNYPSPFFNVQTSSSTPNESFTLGQLGGDDPNLNELDGSLTGVLFPNREYTLVLYATVGTSSDQFVSATGKVQLLFSNVPEPGTAALLGLGLTGLAAVGRRRRAH